MKERVNNGSSAIMIILEKASILITLLIIVAIGLALHFPLGELGSCSDSPWDRLYSDIIISSTYDRY